MPRKPKPAIKRRTQEEDWRVFYLLHGKLPFDLGESFEAFLFCGPGNVEEQDQVWAEVKGKLLQEWTRKRPCTRPWMWWKVDAPRQKDNDVKAYWHNKLPVERRKVVGNAKKTTLSYFPYYAWGVYKYWEFDGEPPLFESEAVYLRRLGLLTKAEERHLERHPELLEPVGYYEIFDEK